MIGTKQHTVVRKLSRFITNHYNTVCTIVNGLNPGVSVVRVV